MPEVAKLLLDAATRDRDRKMPQIPCEEVFGAADGRDRNVQGIIRNGCRNETSGKQEVGERIYAVRDLKQVAIGDECEAPGGRFGIARPSFAHDDRGCNRGVLLSMTLPPRARQALMYGDDVVARVASSEVAEHVVSTYTVAGAMKARYHDGAIISLGLATRSDWLHGAQQPRRAHRSAPLAAALLPSQPR